MSPLFHSQQEAGLALNRSEVGKKTGRFISCSIRGWQEQFPVPLCVPRTVLQGGTSKHMNWSRGQLHLTGLAFEIHFVRCAPSAQLQKQ